MESASDILYFIGKSAGIFLAVVAGCFVLVVFAGYLAHRSRLRELRAARSHNHDSAHCTPPTTAHSAPCAHKPDTGKERKSAENCEQIKK